MEFTQWLREPHQEAREAVKDALAAVERGDREACAQSAKTAVLVYLQRYLMAGGKKAVGESVVDLLEGARTDITDPDSSAHYDYTTATESPR